MRGAGEILAHAALGAISIDALGIMAGQIEAGMAGAGAATLRLAERDLGHLVVVEKLVHIHRAVPWRWSELDAE